MAMTGYAIGQKTRDGKGRSHSPVKGRKAKRGGKR